MAGTNSEVTNRLRAPQRAANAFGGPPADLAAQLRGPAQTSQWSSQGPSWQQPMQPQGDMRAMPTGNPSVGLSDVVRQMQQGISPIDARQQLARVAGVEQRGPGINNGAPIPGGGNGASFGNDAGAFGQSFRDIVNQFRRPPESVGGKGMRPGSEGDWANWRGFPGAPPLHNFTGRNDLYGPAASAYFDAQRSFAPGFGMSANQQNAAVNGAGSRAFYNPFNSPFSGYRGGGPSYDRPYGGFGSQQYGTMK